VNHPRYFVPHAASAAEPVQSDASAVVHVVDAFRLEAAYLVEQEWLVGIDAVGTVHVVPASQRDMLPAATRAQLTHHEVASGRTPRRIAASELYFFAVELVEHPSDAEGFNDPVYLYGHLSGPWPGDAPTRRPGQLTVTRGDVLSGLLHGAVDAFHYLPTQEDPSATRGYHALLPGDRPEVLAQGRGLVLAWPAVPPELQVGNASNGPMVARMIHDVLTQLQEDARANGGPAPLAAMNLPVPSRAMAIAELEMKGYKVKGDVATLSRNHPGLLTRMAEWLTSERVRVPKEATAARFIEVAYHALEDLPFWPTETERVLRALVHPGSGPPRPRSSPRPSTPAAPSATRPQVSTPPVPDAPRPLPPRAPPQPPRPDDWMKDFLDEHAAARSGKAKPKITRTKPVTPESMKNLKDFLDAHAAKPPGGATPGAPAWMKDFGQAPPPEAAPSKPPPPARKHKKPSKAPKPASGKKPDWMNDFEE